MRSMLSICQRYLLLKVSYGDIARLLSCLTSFLHSRTNDDSGPRLIEGELTCDLDGGCLVYRDWIATRSRNRAPDILYLIKLINVTRL